MHFLYSQPDRFQHNLGDESKENGGKIPRKVGHKNDGRLLLKFET